MLIKYKKPPESPCHELFGFLSMYVHILIIVFDDCYAISALTLQCKTTINYFCHHKKQQRSKNVHFCASQSCSRKKNEKVQPRF